MFDFATKFNPSLMSDDKWLAGEDLIRQLRCDSDGNLWWLEQNESGKRIMNRPVGFNNGHGYLLTNYRYNGKKYKFLNHILVWRMVTGSWSTMSLDHINNQKTDNRIDNLRLATHQENMRNSTSRKDSSSKYLGVCLHKRVNKYVANITINSKNTYLGSFDSEIAAALAYNAAALEFFGEFANLNKIDEAA